LRFHGNASSSLTRTAEAASHCKSISMYYRLLSSGCRGASFKRCPAIRTSGFRPANAELSYPGDTVSSFARPGSGRQPRGLE